MTEERAGLPIIAFNDLAALERWPEAQPADSPGLWIKLAKAGSGIASVKGGGHRRGALPWVDRRPARQI
jgi:uncharacterized protein YdeI (YjbR/CyaY-like superfamily)